METRHIKSRNDDDEPTNVNQAQLNNNDKNFIYIAFLHNSLRMHVTVLSLYFSTVLTVIVGQAESRRVETSLPLSR